MSFTIFQNEKTTFQTIKTRISRSRKIHIFSKGLTHRFGPKMAIFPTFFRQAIQASKMSFTIFQREKTLLYSMKKKKFKKSKNLHFSKGVNPRFWSNNGHISNFLFLGNIGRENVFYDILERKTPFQAIKRRSSKSKKKMTFFQRG